MLNKSRFYYYETNKVNVQAAIGEKYYVKHL